MTMKEPISKTANIKSTLQHKRRSLWDGQTGADKGNIDKCKTDCEVRKALFPGPPFWNTNMYMQGEPSIFSHMSMMQSS